MVAAYQAAAARYPQVTSLDDPMFGAQAAPAVWGSRDVSGGYRLEIAQRLPWPGKLALRGANAAATASAARNEVESTRLELVEAALSAFAEYYLVARALEVNEENLRLLREFRQNAETRYKTGQAPQQDVLQSDVEIGRQKERQLTLERMRQVAVARINTLMHLAPDSPLPPPPEKLDVGGELPGADALRALALSRRPNLQAQADRINAERAALALAHKEYYPDFEAMAAYDAMWQEPEMRPMVGLRLNLPVRLDRRSGAVAEASARLAQRQAELARRVDEVNFEVQQAYEQVQESRRAVRLFEEEILTAARANVKSAQSAYVTGQIPFLTLVEAQRELVELRDRYYATVADYLRRRAALERAVGGRLEAGAPHAEDVRDPVQTPATGPPKDK
jgi:outer membrane protein TolC